MLGVFDFRSYFRTHRGRMILSVLALILLPQTAYLQNPRFPEQAKASADLRRRFKLTPVDLARIKPLFDTERNDVLLLYSRFVRGEEPEYSSRVWTELIQRRRDFELRLNPKLSVRQKTAMRGYRIDLEKRALERLIDEFIGFVGDMIEVEEWQLNEMARIFERENLQRLALLNRHLSNPLKLREEMEKVGKTTEKELQGLFSDIQWGEYRLLIEKKDPIA